MMKNDSPRRMTDTLVHYLLWFGAIGCTMLGGLYFAFSTFIMTALGRIDPAAGIGAMNSINATIVRSLFLPLFLGTTLASAVLAIVGVLRLGHPGGAVMLAGGCIYVVGMFVCTMICNVPLNNALAVRGLSPEEAASVWSRYLKQWTMWNHVRTVASTAAGALYIAAIGAGQ